MLGFLCVTDAPTVWTPVHQVAQGRGNTVRRWRQRVSYDDWSEGGKLRMSGELKHDQFAKSVGRAHGCSSRKLTLSFFPSSPPHAPCLAPNNNKKPTERATTRARQAIVVVTRSRNSSTHRRLFSRTRGPCAPSAWATRRVTGSGGLWSTRPATPTGPTGATT